jgi:hypothetical protein
MKVYSHQLSEDFQVTLTDKRPKPNLFVVSANQFADNAATQAHSLTNAIPNITLADYDKIYYAPFSPKWCFSFEGSLTNKGATTILQDRIDQELILHQQYRRKQGLFYRLFSFIGLNAQQLGDESMLRNIAKMTATCWTRCIYRYPPLASQTWDYWYSQLAADLQRALPVSLPKDWRKQSLLADIVVRACPFCEDKRAGTLEHLHLYCKSEYLTEARTHCNEKIESALHEL